MRFARLFMLLAAGAAMYAQTVPPWDTSGNSMLKGTYYFRQVAYSVGDTSGDLGDAAAVYGSITFDGNGNYSITATGATILDAAAQSEGYLGVTTGTYAIGGGGYGFIVSPVSSSDLIFGLVSANGVFAGSTTDNGSGYNDMMIAAKQASPAFTASSFTGSWTLASFDPNYSAGLTPPYMTSAVVSLSPNGNGQLNAGTVKGYYGGSTGLYTQTSSGLSYIFSNGAAVATFPSNGGLIYGQKYLYFSPDGNFLFGGGPADFDMIVGVKTTSTPALSGLYYQVGLDEVVYESEGVGDLDSYFGAFNAIPGSAPQTLLGHQRVNDFGGTVNLAYGASLYDYTYTSPFSLSGSTYTTSSTNFIAGAGGAVLISSGISPSLGLGVSLQAPTPAGTGVYLNPTGVVNSGSDAPFTARIAPGELLTLYGSNLANSTAVAGIPFPTTGLGGVQVTIGGFAAAIYYVSQSQISAIVPYEVTPGTTVNIQVNNNGTLSNVVTQYVSNTAPGVFTQNQNGTGYGEIEHLGIGNSAAVAGSVVTDPDPAIEGESLAAYLTGLGVVSPAIPDGAAGPSGTLSQTSNTIAVDFGGTAGTNDFSGLAPGYSGLYQLNFTVPATGITAGPNYLDIAGDDPNGNLESYMAYLLTPIQATAPATTASDTKPEIAMSSKFHRSRKAGPAVRLPVKRMFSQAGTTDNR